MIKLTSKAKLHVNMESKSTKEELKRKDIIKRRLIINQRYNNILMVKRNPKIPKSVVEI